MYRNIKNLIIYTFVMIISSSQLMAQQEPNNAITLEALPKVVKGFPFIFKITVQGPAKVPLIDLKYDRNPVTIYFKSKSDGKEYIIRSLRPISEVDVIGISPEQMMNRMYPPIDIPKRQKCTEIFDAWSLFAASVRNNIDTCLSDIPPGKYIISVGLESADPLAINPEQVTEEQKINFEKFTGSTLDLSSYIRKTLKSNNIDLEILEPTEKEKQFTEEIRKTGGRFSIPSRIGVNWTTILTRNIKILKDLSSLTRISREQISFHKLISDVNIADEKSIAKSIDEVQKVSLPDFFEPERQLLLLELKGNSAKERDNFLKKYPELKWRVEQLDSGKSTFGIRPRTSNEASPRRERTRILPSD
jgi:hypothetical protein